MGECQLLKSTPVYHERNINGTKPQKLVVKCSVKLEIETLADPSIPCPITRNNVQTWLHR